ncbi:MAG: alpha/beta hydrolase [Alphaproteobacteria bacterium]|nr:alpha/beta hydrolase [Alphaproteobacteria bacterium]
MKTYLLVHGAWHGGWCWRRIDEPLRRSGHVVFAPTLTGLADRSHLLSRDIGLETHVDDIANLIRWHDLNGIVLCGHSYGGMVITGVADRIPDRIRALVHVDSFVPENGQCALDQVSPERRAEIEATIRTAGQGWFAPPTPARRFGVTDPADIAWIDGRCTPQPARCMTDPIHLTGAWHRVPRKVYVLAAANKGSAYQAVHARLHEDRNWETHSVPSGHEMMITHPHQLTEILLSA